VLFVLPYHLILQQLGVDPATIKSQDTLTIPRALLELLLRMLIVRAAFDEADYLARNPDVRAAVQAGQLRSGHEHFLTVGYLEGRQGGCPVVDENWYINAYADVARAVAQGKLVNAADHYITSGAAEWRVPAPDVGQAVAVWRSVLTQPMRGADTDVAAASKPRRKGGEAKAKTAADTPSPLGSKPAASRRGAAKADIAEETAG